MVENLGGQIDHPDVLNERVILGTFPRKWENGEAAFCRTIAFKDLWTAVDLSLCDSLRATLATPFPFAVKEVSGFPGRYSARYPPSTTTSEPVMNVASSLARNATTFATSSGSPTLFIGVLSRIT